jgi:hypothetical protein
LLVSNRAPRLSLLVHSPLARLELPLLNPVRGDLGIVAAYLGDEPLGVLSADEHFELDAEREVGREGVSDIGDRGVTVVSMLIRSAHMWEGPHGMSERGLGAILLAVLILAASCGGDGDCAPRVTLTDKSCTYSGARTHEPGVFDIEAENTTSHLASFAVYELAPGFSIKDVRGFFQRVMVDNNVKPPTPDDFRRNEIWGHADPRATTLLPVNASAGRLVIVCMENVSADTRPSGDVWPAPAAIYVPAELEIR